MSFTGLTSVVFRSFKMIEETSGQHLKDIENILEVWRFTVHFES